MRKLAILLALVAVSASADLTRYASGNPDDARLRLHGPVLILDGGGGSDSVDPYQLAIDRVRGCTDCGRTLDVVVLRASGSDYAVSAGIADPDRLGIGGWSYVRDRLERYLGWYGRYLSAKPGS